MEQTTGQIHAPILSTIAKEILALVRSGADLRKLQGLNAPRACYFDSGTITNTAPYVINEANSGNGEVFYQLVMVFDQAAGAANYRIDGPKPTTTVGLPVPSGGGQLVITGHDNIRNFAIIAQGATTVPFARLLFK